MSLTPSNPIWNRIYSHGLPKITLMHRRGIISWTGKNFRPVLWISCFHTFSLGLKKKSDILVNYDYLLESLNYRLMWLQLMSLAVSTLDKKNLGINTRAEHSGLILTFPAETCWFFVFYQSQVSMIWTYRGVCTRVRSQTQIIEQKWKAAVWQQVKASLPSLSSCFLIEWLLNR